MDINNALTYLNIYHVEIITLKGEAANYRRFQLWTNEVHTVVKAAFGQGSEELKCLPSHSMFIMLFSKLSDAEKQKTYLSELDEYEIGISKILQKYEILGIPTNPDVNIAKGETDRPKAFISHGKESNALSKLREFITALGIDPLVVEHQASKDMALDSKVEHYLEQADCVIILATGDDNINGKLHPRQNVIHETGLAQKSFPGKIIYLLEKGAEFPSNISPKVRVSFTKELIDQAFIAVARELKAFGIIKAEKPK